MSLPQEDARNDIATHAARGPGLLLKSALIAIVSTGIIAWIFYPGFMTFDSVYALNSAREGVTSSAWPPMVSYIWRIVDLFSTDPSLMHAVQVFILFFSVSYILLSATGSFKLAVLFALAVMAIPYSLGTLAAIWKDVLMAALLFMSVALYLMSRGRSSEATRYGLIATSFVVLFIGICTRHNAIAAALPLGFFYLWDMSGAQKGTLFARLRFSVLLTLVLFAAMFGAKLFLDKYSLPDLRKIGGSAGNIEIVQKMDLLGASVCLDENLLAPLSPDMTLERIKSNYDPRHSNLSMDLLNSTPSGKKIGEYWFKTAIGHPICFWANKLLLLKYLTGFHNGPQFLVVSAEIHQNDYGLALEPSGIRDFFVEYIISSSNAFIFKPFFIYVLLVLTTPWLVGGLMRLPVANAIFLSAVLYGVSLVLAGNAADARMLFHSNISVLLLLFIGVHQFIKAHSKRSS